MSMFLLTVICSFLNHRGKEKQNPLKWMCEQKLATTAQHMFPYRGIHIRSFPPVKDGVMFSLPPLSVMEKPTGFFSNDGNLYYRNKGVGDDLSFQPLRTHSPFLDAFIFTFAGYSCHMQVTIIRTLPYLG